ncbi:VOC family protein [Sulfobacillus harzensis]|uniref:Glyoxalase/bleomycin resistance/dioxygenase family protein n=1 Tax=Sulfobacillus harzensis TaxID=2729629 RepID=A0A7Y0Q2U5_9FIRM|nr:glyoxalase/bleomycin resistance/dioxygenase family protein [Sulfobacillus harzensis]
MEGIFGINLFTERYEACVAFYEQVLGLVAYRRTDSLTGFRINERTYLLVERGGVATATEKSPEQNPTVLRWDVADLPSAVTRLESRGAVFRERCKRFSWGTIAVLLDPDGNRIELGEIGPTSLPPTQE